MARTAIAAVGLNKWFGEGESKTHAVKDVTFDAYFGEILYVVGPSGSGKTTMLSMISGIRESAKWDYQAHVHNCRGHSGSAKVCQPVRHAISNQAHR